MSINPRRRPSKAAEPLISIVLPVYNEVAVLHQLVEEIDGVMLDLPYRHEIVFVNDGSRDGSAEVLDTLAAQHAHLRVLHFSRNFGHQPAVQAGLHYARGDAVVVMDSDLQDSPAAIPDFLAAWERGADVVYAVRTKRKEALWKRALFYAYYRLLNCLVATPLPEDAGNFSLLDRAALDHVVAIADYDRYFPGLRHWVGFQQQGIPVERRARHDQYPRVSLRQLFALAKTALFGFSRAPLSLFYAIAAISLLVFLGCSGFALYHRLVTHLAVPGWTSITMIVSLFGALNALGISFLGEYVVRIYDQVRQRPPFVVARDSAARSTGVGSIGSAPRCLEESDLATALQDQVAQMALDLHDSLQGTSASHPTEPTTTPMHSNAG